MSMIKHYIPNYFQAGGVEFNTIIKKDSQNAGNLGHSNITDGEIAIQFENAGRQLSHTQVQNTYFHELAHMLLETIGELTLTQNETFVQNLGNALFEFMRTATWVRIEEFQHNCLSPAAKIPPFVAVAKDISPLVFTSTFTLDDKTKCKCTIETNKPMNQILIRNYMEKNLKTIVEGLVESFAKSTYGTCL